MFLCLAKLDSPVGFYKTPKLTGWCHDCHRKLKTELLDVKRKGAKRGSGKYSERICGRCLEPLSRLTIFSTQCETCNHHVCSNCRTVLPDGSWTCSVCAKESWDTIFFMLLLLRPSPGFLWLDSCFVYLVHTHGCCTIPNKDVNDTGLKIVTHKKRCKEGNVFENSKRYCNQ